MISRASLTAQSGQYYLQLLAANADRAGGPVSERSFDATGAGPRQQQRRMTPAEAEAQEALRRGLMVAQAVILLAEFAFQLLVLLVLGLIFLSLLEVPFWIFAAIIFVGLAYLAWRRYFAGLELFGQLKRQVTGQAMTRAEQDSYRRGFLIGLAIHFLSVTLSLFFVVRILGEPMDVMGVDVAAELGLTLRDVVGTLIASLVIYVAQAFFRGQPIGVRAAPA